MPRLIDADDLLMDNSWAFYDENGNRNDACIAVENAPTVDAVEVVRCKDCRYWDTNGYGAEYDSEGYGWCEEIGEFDTKKDWYCGWGERREDG